MWTPEYPNWSGGIEKKYESGNTIKNSIYKSFDSLQPKDWSRHMGQNGHWQSIIDKKELYSNKPYLVKYAQYAKEMENSQKWLIINGIIINNFEQLQAMYEAEKKYTTWVSLAVPSEAIRKCFDWIQIHWVEEKSWEIQATKKLKIIKHSEAELKNLSQEIQPKITKKEREKLQARLEQDAEYYKKQREWKQRLVYNPSTRTMDWVNKV